MACVYRLLKETMQSAEELSEGSDFEITLRDLRVSEELKMKIDELRDLYMQDKNKYLRDKEPLLTSKSLTLTMQVNGSSDWVLTCICKLTLTN